MVGIGVLGEEYDEASSFFLDIPLQHWLNGVDLESQCVRGMVLARDSVGLRLPYADSFPRSQDSRLFQPRVECAWVRGGEVQGRGGGGEEDD